MSDKNTPVNTPDGAHGTVELRGVTRIFGDRTVLDGIDLEIAEGEFVAVLGRSGSGKTTLLRILAGLDSGTTAGTVRTGERSAVVFQDARLLPWRDARTNVALGTQVAHGADADAAAVDALGEVGLAEHVDSWPRRLSGGQRQRVALARALVQEPDLLLVDEPFSALDAFTRVEAQELVLKLWQRHGPAVLLVTHDVDEAVRLADRVVVLDGGRVIHDRHIDLPRPRGVEDEGVRRIAAELLTHLDRSTAAKSAETVAAVGHSRSAWTRRGALVATVAGAASLVAFTRPRDAAQRVQAAEVATGGSAEGATLRVAVQTDGVRALLSASEQLKDLPYRIEFAQFSFGPAIVEALGAAKVDIGGVGTTPPIFGAAAQTNFRVVATLGLANRRDCEIIVPKGSAIQSVAQLRGRKIAVPKGSSAHGLVLNALHRAGLGVNDVTFVFLAPADGAAAFSGGEVDAWAVWEPFLTQQHQAGARRLAGGPPDEEGLNFQLLSTQALADPARVAAARDYLQRLKRAFAWATTHQDAYAKAWASESKFPLAVARAAIPNRLSSLGPVTSAHVASEQRLADRLVQDKVIPTAVRFEEIVQRGLI